MIGLIRSAICTVVKRTTRFTLLIHLPREDGYGLIPRTKNGPAFADYGAITMKNAPSTAMSSLPDQLARSLTRDRGKGRSAHADFTAETGIRGVFADSRSPWQRGTNENTNGLLRQYLPKDTDLARWSNDDLQAVAAEINSRPRKILGWKTPSEAFGEHLRSLQKPVLRRPVESVQYTSLEFTNRLHDWGLVGSYGSVGHCFDNAAMETFWAAMKNEVRHICGPTDQRTRSEMRTILFDYIEIFYNRTHHQAGLGHRTPAEVYAAVVAG